MRLEGNYEHDKNAIEIKTKEGRQRERGKKEKKKVRFSQLVKKLLRRLFK